MKPFKAKFKRIETKYLLTQAQLRALQHDLNDYVDDNQYATSTIANLYYDTPTYQLIRHSLEKPNYKEKLRVRSYLAQPTLETEGCLEVKKKFQKVVYKRRTQASLAQLTDFLAGEGQELADAQVQAEVNWLMTQYPDVQPAMYIYYDRYSMQGKEDPDLRLTVDSNICYRSYDLDLTKGVYGDALLPPGHVILEIKAEGAYPVWLAQLLAKHRIYKTSFSKYGTAYQLIKEQRGIAHA